MKKLQFFNSQKFEATLHSYRKVQELLQFALNLFDRLELSEATPEMLLEIITNESAEYYTIYEAAEKSLKDKLQAAGITAHALVDASLKELRKNFEMFSQEVFDKRLELFRHTGGYGVDTSLIHLSKFKVSKDLKISLDKSLESELTEKYTLIAPPELQKHVDKLFKAANDLQEYADSLNLEMKVFGTHFERLNNWPIFVFPNQEGEFAIDGRMLGRFIEGEKDLQNSK